LRQRSKQITFGNLTLKFKNNMKAVIFLAKAFNAIMGTSVGVAVAFALYKVLTGQTGGMSI